MTIRLPHSCFIHLPRTGGLWMGRLIEEIGLPHQTLKGDFDSHLFPDQMPSQQWDKLTKFTLIRHPWDWIQSRWSHALEHNIIRDCRHFGPHRELDLWFRQSSFEDTIRQYLRRCMDALVSEVYVRATMSVLSKNIICTERLPDCAYAILSRLEDIPQQTWDSLPEIAPFNGTRETYKAQLVCSGELKEQFLEKERRALTIWKTHYDQG